ncbi:MAG: YhbY family RNA-binding protein [bacterium]|nr:YhbY family RNA-binding protein [bacterium]
MNKLKGFQRKYLRGLAHNMKPTVLIGQKGYTDTVIRAIKDALETHELIKIKFVDLKDKARKNEILGSIEENIGCENVGVIGHTAIFYREHDDPEKRGIRLPEGKDGRGAA